MAPVLGTQICAYEQVVYYVLEGPVLNKDPAKWQATIRVFNVWDQVEQTITFKIKEWVRDIVARKKKSPH